MLPNGFLLLPSYQTLGLAGHAMGHDFYSLPTLAHCIVEYVVGSLEHLPNYRMRFVIHILLDFYSVSWNFLEYYA